MSRYTKYVKADLVQFLESKDSEINGLRNKFWALQHELTACQEADKETLDTARAKVMDTVYPLAAENSKALLYFWERLEFEKNFGSIPADVFALIKDIWEQSEADSAAIKLETMSE